jgi:hypothetical protein
LFFLIWGFFVAGFWLNQFRETHLYVVNGAKGEIVADADGMATEPIKADGWAELTLKTKHAEVRVTQRANGAVSVHPVKRAGVYILNVGPSYSVRYGVLKYVKNPKDPLDQAMRRFLGAELSFNHPPSLENEGLLRLENVRPGDIILDFDTAVPETVMGTGEETRVKLWKQKK